MNWKGDNYLTMARNGCSEGEWKETTQESAYFEQGHGDVSVSIICVITFIVG